MTEEDYRVRNAREGKAFYVPGKTVEQMKAEQARAADPMTVKLKLTEAEAERLCDALDEVSYTYNNAAQLFDLMFQAMAGGMFDADHPGVLALCEVASKAFAHAADDGGNVLGNLSTQLKIDTSPQNTAKGAKA